MNFVINDYIRMVLEDNKTIIYFDDKPFRICKGLVLNLSIGELYKLQDFSTIDEQIEYLQVVESDIEAQRFEISPLDEFFVHCSNIQAWVELGYDTALLDHRLSFPLLRLLVRKKDKKAIKVYKEEIAKRFQTTFLTVPFFLIVEHFLDYLNSEEFNWISIQHNPKLKKSIKKALKSMDKKTEFDIKTEFDMAIEILKYLSFSYGDKYAMRILKSLLNRMMIYNPDRVVDFLDFSFPMTELSSSDLHYFIMHSPVFLELLTIDSSIIELFKEATHRLKAERLNLMLNEILFIINFNEPKRNIHVYLVKCLREHKIMADLIDKGILQE